MTAVAPILSLLHEPPGNDSTTRQFRGEPVLAWTLRRLARAPGCDRPTALCWEDQAAAVAGIGAAAFAAGPRRAIGQIESVAAARRWADGWRGGLLGTCEFDRGFHAPSADQIRRRNEADAVLLIDPSAGLLDAALVEDLLRHARSLPDVDLCFSQAAPGLSGVLVKAPLLDKLAVTQTHPGALLGYRPDSPRRDPIAEPACAPIPVPLARTIRRFTLDSRRQIELLSAATESLNGELMSAGALNLLARVEQIDFIEPLPRELVMELNTERATEAIFRPGKRLDIRRKPLGLDTARRLIAELAEMDDSRLVLAGVGDPLLHDDLLEIIAAAHSAGIGAIAVESDFVGCPPERVAALADSPVDIVSVHFPAATAATYQAVMGTDCFAAAGANIRLFLEKRAALGRGTPLLVPTFVKCKVNQGEMETWYDHWLRALGCAVVSGPSDYGGLTPDVSPVDMSGPRRRPCASLSRRLSLLCDGTIVSCEQDVIGRQVLGRGLKQAWKEAEMMRRDHQNGQWSKHPACAGCKEWHR